MTHSASSTTHNTLFASPHKLSTAESCTGGMIATQLTEHPGSSRYFERGFVTYSNDAKREMLGVSSACLAQHGAVSPETAKAMAEGALRNSHADISLSVTGIAGPDGGSIEKPVGTVSFAWASTSQATKTATKFFNGSRTDIRKQAADFALTTLVDYLKL